MATKKTPVLKAVKPEKKEMFDKTKIRMLSPDADDWNDLVDQTYRNQENMIDGVLLHAAKGITADAIEMDMMEFIEQTLPASGHGSVEIIRVEKRGKDWAVAYAITAWYNHFDLNEEYD